MSEAIGESRTFKRLSMSGVAVRAAVAAVAAAGMASCSGGGQASTSPGSTPTAVPSAPAVVTPATVPPHDLAVALRQVLTKGTAELNTTSAELQRAATLDQAAQTMDNHAANFNALHNTLEQLPAFPVAQTQTAVKKLSTDLAALSSVISAMTAAEVSQYAQYKQQINAQIPVVGQDIGVVGNDLKGY
jgi:hypothetical protein